MLNTHPNEKVKNILLVFSQLSQKVRVDKLDYLYSFEKYSNHNIFYFNTYYFLDLPQDIREIKFDLIIFLPHFLDQRANSEYFKHLMNSKIFNNLKKQDCLKIALPQDEYFNTDILNEFIIQFDINYVFSTLHPSIWHTVYNKINFKKVNFHQVLPAYLDEERVEQLQYLQSLNNKTIDIGSYYKEVEPWKGDIFWQVKRIDPLFFDNLSTRWIVTASKSKEYEMFGDDWYKYLVNCKYILGTEEGSNILDRNGEIRNRTERFLRQNTDVSYHDLKNQVLNNPENQVDLFTISSVHLEAIAAKTCLVLLEGTYNNLLKRDLHYIELKKDLSNVEQIIEIIKDDKLRQNINERAYNDIVESGAYSYRKFVEQILSIVYPGIISGKNPERIAAEKQITEHLSTSFYYIKNRDLITSLSLLKKVYNDDPVNFEALSSIGYIYFVLGENNKAVKYLNMAKQVKSDDILVNNTLAKVYISLDSKDVAEEYVSESLITDPENIDAQKILGHILFTKGKISDAEKIYNKLLKSNQRDIEILTTTARINGLSGKYDEAVNLLRKAIEVDDKDWQTWYELAICGKQLNDIQLFSKSIKKAAELNPEIMSSEEYQLLEINSKEEVFVRNEDPDLRNEILIIYNHPVNANAPTMMEHIDAFCKYSRFKVCRINTELGFPEKLRYVGFKIIILHYSLFGRYPFPMQDEFKLFLLKNKNSMKICFFQDENYNCPQRFDFINRYGINKIYTLIEPEYYKDVYLKYTKVSDLRFNLTGYVSEELKILAQKFRKPFNERAIDIGYRARKLAFYNGKGAQEKYLIGIHFKELIKTLNLNVDIETDESKRIYGDNWYRFVANCKAMLGVEAGTSIFDLEGTAKRECEKYLVQNPFAEFEEVYENVLNKYEDKIFYRTNSPRHFEAAAFHVVQILFEGKYSGVLKPYEHYIPLKKDYSNINEVISLFKDEQFRNKLLENSYNDLISSGKYSYEKFIRDFDEDLINFGIRPEQMELNSKTNSFVETTVDLSTENLQDGYFLKELEEQINSQLSEISKTSYVEAWKLNNLLLKKHLRQLRKFKSGSDEKVFKYFLSERKDFIKYLYSRDIEKEIECNEGNLSSSLNDTRQLSMVDLNPLQNNIYKRKLNILIVIASPTREIRTTIKDHILAFERYSGHNIYYLNVLYEKTFPSEMMNVKFDLVIFHTIFLSARWDIQHFRKLLESDIVQFLKQIDSIKVIIPQDEFLNTDAVSDFINDFKIKHVFTCAPEEEWNNIYPNIDFNKTKLHTVLTGYIDISTLNIINTLEEKCLERSIDIGYRAWHSEEWLGRHGLLKCQIADVFKTAALNTNLNIDISTKEEDTFYGNKWYEFLLRCKYFIGVEGGASLLDRDGRLKDLTRAYKKLHPDSTFEEVETACFPGQDGNLKLFAISPRHLEACATKTCQILIEGNYNGILLPGVHYIELKRDYSNLNEVMELIRDGRLRENITEKAYNDIILSGKYNYKSFVDFVISESLNEITGNKNKTKLNGREPVLHHDDEFKNPLHNSITDKLVKQAEFQINQNNVFGALSSVNSILRMNPDDLAGKYLYNAVLFKLDETETALKNLVNLIKENPDNDSFRILAADIEINRKNYSKAEDYLRNTIIASPSNIYALNLYGKLKYLQGDYNEAVKILNHSLEISKNNPYALLLLGKIYRLSSDYNKALEYLKRFVEYDNVNVEAWSEILSIAHIIQNESLIKTAEKIVKELDPKNPELKKYKTSEQEVIKQDYPRRTKGVLQKEDEIHILPSNTVIDKDKLSFDVKIAQFDMLLERGTSLLQKNKLEAAAGSLIRASEIDPEHPVLLFNIGLYFLLKQSPDRAVLYFQKVIERYPSYPQIDLCIGLAFDFAGESKKAEYFYLKADEKSEDELLISKLLFLFFARQAKYTEAKIVLMRAYKKNPQDLQVLLFLAKLAEFENDLESAKKLFNDILILSPENSPAKRGLRRIDLEYKNGTTNNSDEIQTNTITMLVDDRRIDRRVLDEAETLSNSGWKVVVIAGHPSDEFGLNDENTYPSLNIIRVKDKGSFSLELLDGLVNYEIKLCRRKGNQEKINRILAEVLPDKEHHNYFNDHYYQNFFIEALENPAKIFVGHDLTQLTTALVAAKYYGSHIVYDSHELYPGQFTEPYIINKISGLERSLIKFVDRTITVNESISLEFQKNYGIKAEVILNCPSAKNYKFPLIRKDYFRDKFRLSKDTKVLMYQGNLTARVRNLENLIEAMKLINNKKIILVLMGPDYGDKKILEGLAKNLGLLNKKVFFHKAVAQSEILNYTTSADAGIIPYPPINKNHYFCTPNKLFEFLVAGLPIIANDLPELKNFVSNQGAGMNFVMNNARDIASAIDSFFSSDMQSYRRSLESLSEKYIWKSQEDNLKRIYNEVLSHNKSAGELS